MRVSGRGGVHARMRVCIGRRRPGGSMCVFETIGGEKLTNLVDKLSRQ